MLLVVLVDQVAGFQTDDRVDRFPELGGGAVGVDLAIVLLAAGVEDVAKALVATLRIGTFVVIVDCLAKAHGVTATGGNDEVLLLDQENLLLGAIAERAADQDVLHGAPFQSLGVVLVFQLHRELQVLHEA